MAKGNSQKANGSNLDFEAQLWAAAEQAVPAPNCNRRKWWPCASTMSDWGGENLRQDVRCFSLSAANEIPRSRERERMSAGQVRVVGEKQFNAERAGVRCRIHSLPVNNAR